MVIRALFALALSGTVSAACAPPEETQQTQPSQGQQVSQVQPATTPCWIRGDTSGLAQRASAFDSASVTLGSRTIKLCYSRPQMKGRTIMGGLVPYGRPWRIGANEATAIHMPAAGTIAGVAVAPGSYSLYVVPAENEWRVVVNRNAERWGVPINAAVTANDVGAGTVRPEAISNPVEALTARFEGATANSATLVFEWERTRLSVPVTLQ